MRLDEIVGIVTGGAGGFGQSFAAAILAAGGRVVITDLDSGKLQAAGERLATQYDAANRIAWMPQDVTNRASFHHVFAFAAKRLGSAVNMLVNNAGVHGEADLLTEDASLAWERLVDVNLLAVMRGTQVAVQQMRQHLQRKPGVVVNIASGAGLFPLEQAPEYTAAKFGVVGLTRVCAPQQAMSNVRVVALCPTFTNTAMGDFAIETMPGIVDAMGGLLEVQNVTKAFVKIVEDDANAGQCYFMYPGGERYFPFPEITDM